MANTRCTASGPRTITTAGPVAGALVRRDDAAQAGRVEERQLGEVDHHRRRRIGLHPAELLLHLGDGGQVKLSHQGDVHESVPVLGLDLEDLHRASN